MVTKKKKKGFFFDSTYCCLRSLAGSCMLLSPFSSSNKRR